LKRTKLDNNSSDNLQVAIIILSFILLLFTLITVFLRHTANGDTFIALSGGKGILNGLLLSPDN